MTSNYDINRRRPDIRFNRTKKDFSEVMIHATDKQLEKIVRKAVNDSAREMREIRESTIDKELDELMLKNACWQYDDYYGARAGVKSLIMRERERAKKFMYDRLGLPMWSPSGDKNEFERWLDEHYE